MNNVTPTVSSGGGSIMVWGRIFLETRTEFVVVNDDALTADWYILHILQDQVYLLSLI